MSRLIKNPFAWVCVVLLLAVWALKSQATDSGWSSGMEPTRISTLKIDRYAGTPMNGLYIGTATFAGGTTATVTLTSKSGQGASTSAIPFTSKNTGSSTTYVKSATITSTGVGLLTMSGATTGIVTFMAIDTFTDPLTF